MSKPRNGSSKTRPNDKGGIAPDDSEEIFKEGVILLKRNQLRDAMVAFKRALDMRPKEARYLSYYGLCLAATGKRPREGVKLCEKAAAEVFYRPELFLNLGKAWIIAGNRDKAQEAFRTGLVLDSGNREIMAQLESLGIRKPLFFPFFDRRNALNRWVGKVRHVLAPKEKQVERRTAR
jgi:Tfp pilus assembly protein PilF